MIEIHPVPGLGEVRPGDNLASLLTPCLIALRAQGGDVLVVTQKIVSKAEGRLVRLCDVTPSVRARLLAEATRKDPRLVELALQESSAVVRAAPRVLITRHRLGFVMANAGIDRSNVGDDPEAALLLPEDPDASARRMAEALSRALGANLGVVISDSFGRPWRLGVVNVAIGASGVASLIDRRGELDRDGRRLEVTQVAFADLLASAAGLAMGEGKEGLPAALVRGSPATTGEAPAQTLIRPVDQDLFR